jgi:hypothetical protein
MTDRAQASTLEGVIAAIVVASAVILGFQAVDVAPWTSGPDENRIESLRSQASDLLAVAADNGTLTRAVTCVETNTTTNAYDPDLDAYKRNPAQATSTLGPMLNATFFENGFRYNVYLRYWNGTSDEQDRSFAYPSGEELQQPQNGVVTVTRQVVLYDSMPTRSGPNCLTRGDALGDTDLYVEDYYPDSPVYNVVEVVVEVW